MLGFLLRCVAVHPVVLLALTPWIDQLADGILKSI